MKQPGEEGLDYLGRFTEHLHQHVEVGSVVMVDPLPEREQLSIPEYRGEATFTFKQNDMRVEKLCLVCHSNDTDIIPLFNFAQAILLGDAVDDIKTVMLFIAVDKDEEELKNVNQLKNRIIPYQIAELQKMFSQKFFISFESRKTSKFLDLMAFIKGERKLIDLGEKEGGAAAIDSTERLNVPRSSVLKDVNEKFF